LDYVKLICKVDGIGDSGELYLILDDAFSIREPNTINIEKLTPSEELLYKMEY
jgi:hypothetical protein